MELNTLLTKTRLTYIYATAADMVLCAIIGLVLALWIGGTFGTVAGTLVGFALFIALMYCFVNYWEIHFVPTATAVTTINSIPVVPAVPPVPKV